MNLGIRVLRLAVIGCLTVVASLVGVSAEAITIAPNLCQGTSLTNCPNPDTGAIAPNSGTWIQADITGAGTVHVDMFGVLGTQAVDIWWFNLNPSVTGTLALTNFSVSNGTLTAPTLTT